MKICQSALLAASIALSALGGKCAIAEVLTVPFSAASTGISGSEPCAEYLAWAYVSGLTGCYVQFPINIPAGRTIQQITLFHSTDSAVQFPFISVSLYPPWTVEEKFTWTSMNYVLDGTIDGHKLMAQKTVLGNGTVYLDQFQVAPTTMYNVVVYISNGAAVQGVEVKYF